MKKHPVVVSSNKVNRYGFRMLTSGGDLSQYAKNPVILYAHRRPNYDNPKLMPIGKLHDVRLSGEQIVGELEFDQDDDFAVSIEKKWEKGMLNAVSIGAEVIATSENPAVMLPGQKYPTVTEWVLEEVSVVDIPADIDAVAIRLHHKGDKTQVITLGEDSTFDPTTLFPTKPNTSMKLIQLALSGHKTIQLAEGANEEQIAKAISTLVKEANENADKVVQLKADNENHVKTIDALNQKVQSIELKHQNERAEALVDAAVAEKKITPAERAQYVELAKSNFDTVKTILDNKKGFKSMAEEAGKSGKGGVDYTTLSYDELDKKGLLVTLKSENVELFKQKFQEKFGKEPKL
jgi:hypothetical protein